MSKAFTSEENEDEPWVEPPPLPPGTRNYMTPPGAAALQKEWDALSAERQRLNPQVVADQNRIRSIDRRLGFLASRRDALQVIDPVTQDPAVVRFGATVLLKDATGAQETWRIVGIDEADLDKGWISWMSPFASTLLDHRVGDTFAFQKRTLTLLSIQY